MKKRIIFANGNLISIVDQEKALGDAENFMLSRQNPYTCALIGTYGKKYELEKIKQNMPEASFEISNKKIFSIIHKIDGRYLGDVRITKLEEKNEYEIGILITERNKGYGTDTIKTVSEFAFNTLHAEKLHVRIFANNLISYSFFKKLGFKQYKTKNEFYRVNGINFRTSFLCLTP